MKFIGESVGTQRNFPPILLFIFYYKYHPNREGAAFREPLLVFSENLTRKGGRDTPNISQEKKKSAKTPFEGNWSFIARTEFLFISMEHQALRKKSQKPVRLRKTGSICGDYTEDEDGHIACVSFDLIRKE